MSIKYQHGQSLIELIMILPIMIGFWAAIVWFARVFIIEIELLNTARHGVFWLAYQTDSTLSSDDETKLAGAECYSFLKAQDSSLDTDRLTLQVQAGDRWHPVKWGMPAAITASVLLGNDTVSQIARQAMIGRLAGVDKNVTPASVTLNYSLDTPPLLRAIPGFPPTIPLRGYCVCYR